MLSIGFYPLKVRAKTKEIQDFIKMMVQEHPRDIVRVTSDQFGISRQAASRHVRLLVESSDLVSDGATRNKAYALRMPQPTATVEWDDLSSIAAEDVVWSEQVLPLVADLPRNVVDIWQYAFTEMFNNVLEHSGSTYAALFVWKDETKTRMYLMDR